MTPTPPVRLESDFQVYGNGNVRPHRVHFDMGDPACLARNPDGTLTFRLLGPVEVVEGTLAVRAGRKALGYGLQLVGASGATSLWQVTLEPPAESFSFSFALLLADGSPVYLAPTGITSAIERLDRFSIAVDVIRPHPAPAWAAGAVIYQVFPDRFANGDPSLDPPGVEPWDVIPTSHSFLGGDLDGIAAHVGHLVDLGIDAVYLNPIFASPSNHRYDAVDYMAVDPTVGGDEALRRLVAALHGNDIRLILDASFNHCHPRFFAFSDIVEKGRDSAYASWFAVREWPVRVRYRPHLLDPTTYWGRHLDRLRNETGIPVEAVDDEGPVIEPTYDTWYGVPIMPRIELSDPAARRYMLDVATHWVREFGVDGWRMDVVRYIDHDFWVEFRSEVKAAKPEAYLVAEVMGDARRWLRGDEFDATMNYTFRELSVDYFATGVIGTDVFLEGVLAMLAMYSPVVTAMNHNLLGSHDTPRFLTLAGNDRRSLLLATLFQLTFPGAPGLYYGDELPMPGAGDPDNRRGFDWGAVGSQHHDAVRDLLRLRRRHPALRTGSWRLLARSGDGFVYARQAEGTPVTIGINAGAGSAVVPLEDTGAEVAWSVGDVTVRLDELHLGPRSGAVLA